MTAIAAASYDTLPAIPRTADEFRRHNEEVKQVWDAYRAKRPIRTPVTLGVNTRYYLLGAKAPLRHVDFRAYIENPDVMFETQLQAQHWKRHNLLHDAPMGLPTPEEGWTIGVDFQNFYEAGWFGCELAYFDGQVPDTHPKFTADETKRDIMAQGDLDPFGGMFGRIKQYYEHFQARAARETFHGLPIKKINPSGMGTDGPLTVAANIRGATELFTDFVEDPGYVHELLDYITTQTIRRIKAWRRYLGQPERQPGYWFADDSVQLISGKMYRDFVLPCHRRLRAELSSTPTGGAIHLCGDSSRHFKTIVDELKLESIDTGFPLDHGKVRRTLGPEIELLGGPHIELMRSGSARETYDCAVRILQSGVMDGGRFVLREGNNLAPETPLENIAALYQAAKDHGTYR